MKIEGNPYVDGSYGKFGAGVYKRVRGKIVVAVRPKSRTTFTPNQEKVKERFKDAVLYAKRAVANEATKAEYATGINDNVHSAYAVAFTDFLKGPKVRSVDASRYKGAIGDKIEINAIDDFKVVSVYVEVRSADNTLLESGEAVQSENPIIWHYTATQANQALAGTKITVLAKDKPGNLGSGNTTL